MTETNNRGLQRELGLLDAVGIGFGAVIGAGIFVVIGVAAGIAGPALLLGLVIAGIAAACNALSSAQLAAEYPQAGGTYEYGYQLIGPATGFAAGWMFLSSKIAAAGTVALGLAGYLAALWPSASPRLVAVAAVIAFTALNYFGIRRSSRTNLIIVAVSLTALLLFAGYGLTQFKTGNLEPFAPSSWRGTLEAAALLFFAYTGYARIATIAEEVREPRKTIPRAIVITIGGAIALHLLVALAALGMVGAHELAESTAPLHAAARAGGSGMIATMVAVGAVTAMLGVIFSQVLGLSRMTFAMARRGDLPAFLATIHPTTSVPGNAVLFVGAIAATVAATATLKSVASAAAFTILVYYAIANVAALRMRKEAKLYPDVVPAIGLFGCMLLAVSLPLNIIAIGIALLAAGFAARLLIRQR